MHVTKKNAASHSHHMLIKHSSSEKGYKYNMRNYFQAKLFSCQTSFSIWYIQHLLYIYTKNVEFHIVELFFFEWTTYTYICIIVSNAMVVLQCILYWKIEVQLQTKCVKEKWMKKKTFIISESFTQKLSIGINRGAITNKMRMLTYQLIVVGE